MLRTQIDILPVWTSTEDIKDINSARRPAHCIALHSLGQKKADGRFNLFKKIKYNQKSSEINTHIQILFHFFFFK